MHTFDNRLIQTILTSGAIGGLTLLSIVAVFLAFDILSIATLIGDSANREVISAVLLGGALTKGVAFGAATGVALYASGRGALHAVPIRVVSDRLS